MVRSFEEISEAVRASRRRTAFSRAFAGAREEIRLKGALKMSGKKENLGRIKKALSKKHTSHTIIKSEKRAILDLRKGNPIPERKIFFHEDDIGKDNVLFS